MKARQVQQMQLMHSPRLATVLMVEDTLKQAKETIKVAELKRRLPKQVMHSTLIQILDYLQDSGKILIATKGVVWIYRPPAELEKLKMGGLEL
jgi:cobalamin-dependent methionine synthase I